MVSVQLCQVGDNQRQLSVLLWLGWPSCIILISTAFLLLFMCVCCVCVRELCWTLIILCVFYERYFFTNLLLLLITFINSRTGIVAQEKLLPYLKMQQTKMLCWRMILILKQKKSFY